MKKIKKEKKAPAVETQVSCDDLYLRLFAARAARNVESRKRASLEAILLALAEEEARKCEARERAWRFAGKLLMLLLLSFGSTVSAIGCITHGIWWASIAPFVLLFLTILSVRGLPE